MAINLQCSDCQTGNNNACPVNPTITTTVPDAATIAATVKAKAQNAIPSGGSIGCAGAGDKTKDVTKFIRKLAQQNARSGGQAWKIPGGAAKKILGVCGTSFQATWSYNINVNISVTGSGSGTVNCSCQKKCDNCAGCGDCTGSATATLPPERFQNPVGMSCTVTYTLSTNPTVPGVVPGGPAGGPGAFSVRPFFQRAGILAPKKKGGRGGGNKGGGKKNAGAYLHRSGPATCTEPGDLGLPDANGKAQAVAGMAFGKATGKMKSCGNDPECGQYITGGSASGSCTITVS